MRIYTSYYKKLASEPKGLIPVRISTSEPTWFMWHCEPLTELYPGWDLVTGIKSGSITEEEYAARYKAKLNMLNKSEIIRRLERLSADNDNRDVVLLCYEAPDKFCHRHLVAEWLDIGVDELT